MPSEILPLGGKPAFYFEHSRADVIAYLRTPLGRALDVGCGAGHVGAALKEAGATYLVGIEMDADAAARAREIFDVVYEGDAERMLEGLPDAEQFDLICCYDVLEHLYDPESVIRRLHSVAAPGAVLHISIPNARHLSLVRDLVFRGTFGYEVVGHRDATHLRWFTKSDIVKLVEDCGWKVTGIETHAFRPWRALVSRMSLGYASEFFAVQWYVECRA